MHQTARPLGPSKPSQPAPDRLGGLPNPLDSFPILRSAVEEFVSVEHNRRSLQQRFAALADHFIEEASVEDRRYAAILLAPRQDAPRSTLLKLAHDEISVATPVLKSSPVLEEDDLRCLIIKNESAVNRVIAGRPGLSRSLIQLLLDQNDPSSVCLLYANETVPLIPDMVASVLAEPETFSERTALLASRSDTDAEALARLYMLLDSEQRARARVICEARATLEAMLPGAGALDHVDPSKEPLIDLRELERRAVNQQFEAFTSALSEAAHLTKCQVTQILADREGSALVILLARLGIDQATLIRLLMFTAPHLGNDLGTLKRLGELRHKITDKTARFIVRQWSQDKWGSRDEWGSRDKWGSDQVGRAAAAGKEGRAIAAASSASQRPIPRRETARSLADPQPHSERAGTPHAPPTQQAMRRLTLFGRRRGSF